MENFALKDIEKVASAAVYKRGVDYYDRGLVIEWDFVRGKSHIISLVGNTTVYQQDITILKGEIYGSCSCPVGLNCKHLVAALLAVYNDTLGNKEKNPSDYLSCELSNWLQSLENSIQEKPKSQVLVKKLLYILSKIDNAAIAIQPYVVAFKKDGTLSKNSKPYNIEGFIKTNTKQASFLSFEDLSLLTSISKLKHDYNGKYFLDSSTPNDFLEKVIGTNRCCWGAYDGPKVSIGSRKSVALAWTVLDDGSQKIICDALGDNEEAFVMDKPIYVNTQSGFCGALDLGISEKLGSALLKAPILKPLEVESVKEKLKKYVGVSPIPLPQYTETVLDALLKLRQTCCDPKLLSIKAAQEIKSSAKLEVLLSMLAEMIEEGRRILLFSQFTSMIKIIEERLSEKNINYAKITGSTKDRKTPIDNFQNGKVPLFIISLKSGGTGLNLTAADVVIHYDPWWNPAVEEQATDRAYRIGQDKPVFVYKLIASGTVEEKILAMQDKKLAVARSIFDENTGSDYKLSFDDINALFEPLSVQ